MNCPHKGRKVRQCAICLPKKAWPKGYKPCRCKRLIPKDWAMCPDCKTFAHEDHGRHGHEARISTFRWVADVNKRLEMIPS